MSDNKLAKKLIQIKNLLDEGRTGIEKDKNGEGKFLSRKERSKKLNQASWIVDSVLRDEDKIFYGGKEDVSIKRERSMSV